MCTSRIGNKHEAHVSVCMDRQRHLWPYSSLSQSQALFGCEIALNGQKCRWLYVEMMLYVLRHPAAAGASVEALRQHLRRIDLSFSERLDNPAARGGGWQAAEQPGIGRRAEKVPRFTPCTYAARQETLTPRAARAPVGPSPSAPPWRSSAEIPGPFIPECPQKASAQPFSD
nr:uncharacterized protein LOC113817201 [Penaeus vannamei]